MKLLGESLCNHGLGKEILDVRAKSLIHKRKMDTLDFIKIKIFSSLKVTGKRMNQQDTDLRKIFVICISG